MVKLIFFKLLFFQKKNEIQYRMDTDLTSAINRIK